MGTAVKRRKRKRWPGDKGDAAWLSLKRTFGGEKRAREAILRTISRPWEDNVMAGLVLLAHVPDKVGLPGSGYFVVETVIGEPHA